jgi:hypothetical protein
VNAVDRPEQKPFGLARAINVKRLDFDGADSERIGAERIGCLGVERQGDEERADRDEPPTRP